MDIEEGQLVLCTVKKVTPTITFVELEDGSEGTLISSEIAPGRIKFMRQYVVPNKKIVCKVLKISKNNINLSLRRVTSKEKSEVMQRFKQEQAIETSFKQILSDKEESVKKKILKDFESLLDFSNESKKNSKLIEKYIPKTKQEALSKVINKKRKSGELKQLIKVKCLEDDGVQKIKKVFDLKDDSITVTYISAGKFKLKMTVEDYKSGKKKMMELIQNLEKKAKTNKCEFFASEER